MAAASELLKARALSATVAAERARRELECERVRYMLSESAIAAFGKAFSGFIQDIESTIPDMAEVVGLSRDQIIAFRKRWREFRAPHAKLENDRAAAAPEFVEDPDALASSSRAEW